MSKCYLDFGLGVTKKRATNETEGDGDKWDITGMSLPISSFPTLHLRRWHTNTRSGIHMVDDEIFPIDGAFDVDAEDPPDHAARSSLEDLDIATRAKEPMPSVEIDVGADGFLEKRCELGKL